MENLFEQKLKAKVEEVAAKFADTYDYNEYLRLYPIQFKQAQWIEAIIAYHQYVGNDIWFLDFLLKNLIKENGNLDTFDISERLSCSPLLTDILVRKYNYYLKWDLICRRRKMSFRFMWLMRKYIKPYIHHLKANPNISARKYAKFYKYIELEIKLKRQSYDK